MKKYLPAVLTLCLLIGQACQKDDPAPEPTMFERLTGEWHIHEKIVDGTSEAITDCVKNTSFVFDAERNFILKNYALSATDECLLSQVNGTSILDEDTKVLIFQSSNDDELPHSNIISITSHK